MGKTHGEMVASSPTRAQLPKGMWRETVSEMSAESTLCRAWILGLDAYDEGKDRSSKISKHSWKVSWEAVFSTCQKQQEKEIRRPIRRPSAIQVNLNVGLN